MNGTKTVFGMVSRQIFDKYIARITKVQKKLRINKDIVKFENHNLIF